MKTLNTFLFVLAIFCLALLLLMMVMHHQRIEHEDVIARTERWWNED